jgi:predicted acetyltransferase
MKLKILNDEKSFSEYSKQLQNFEVQFTYPLGSKKFHINHGSENISYFDFFKRLGKVSYFIVLDNNIIIGAGCAILKESIIEGVTEKYWYLGDFKIIKEFRNKGILKKLMLKYFISHYIKSNKLIALNMSPMKENGLVNKVKGIFSWFDVSACPYFIYEWDFNEFVGNVALKNYIKDNFLLFDNNGFKDIVIEESQIPLYHLVDKQYAKDNYPNLVKEIIISEIDKLNENSLFMLGSANKNILSQLDKIDLIASSEASIISHKINIERSRFFTGEI